MAATRDDVNRWIQYAKENNYKIIISVCDTWDYDDYPVYCKNEQEYLEKYPKYNGTNMQSINEVIRINDDGTVKEER